MAMIAHEQLGSIGPPVFILVDQVPELLAPVLAACDRLLSILAQIQADSFGWQVRKLVFRQLLVAVPI